MAAGSGKALVAHGGGPTAVLNASLVGIVEECRRHARIDSLYGALNGAAGLLDEHFVDLFAESQDTWDAIIHSPGSALGTSRKKLSDEDFGRMLETLRRHEIRYVFLTGGNGTMEMALKLSRVCRDAGYEASVIGVPKTIDNDLYGTDHTPGFASAARFFIHGLRFIGADNRALPGVTVVEVLGRNAGWLVASTLLARQEPDDAPHLVYLPERRLPFQQLAADVERVYRKLGRVVVAVCEGQLDENGEPFGADTRTTSKVPLALNLAHVLSMKLTHSLGVNARSEKPGLLGRSFGALASPVDLDEARRCGAAAMQFALRGETGKMVTLDRLAGDAYGTAVGLVSIENVAGRERLFPEAWMPHDATGDSPEFEAWLRPLIGPIHQLGKLDRIPVPR
ncbi:MAG: diphosphate--fructose-6-phosphate 1-phosphotransferase [Bryobacteraceae bacterium]